MAAVVAVPASIMCAVVFAAITVIYIWIVSPALRLVDLSLAILRKVSHLSIMYPLRREKMLTLIA